MQQERSARWRDDAAFASSAAKPKTTPAHWLMRNRRITVPWLAALLVWCDATPASAACTPCESFRPGVSWGATSINALKEASGIAASARNPGMLWTHNDGSRKRVYAISTNGASLATLSFEIDVDDVEDVAVGPGPVNNLSYLYLADIGGNASPDDVRDRVQILRVPEPSVSLAWAGSPRSIDLVDVQSFTLRYPDGSYDAETLLVDPLTADLFIATKEKDSARVYRANIATANPGSVIDLIFVRSLDFEKAAGGDISADGGQIALRRENAAMLWSRCDGESLDAALARPGTPIPVIGPPTEDNGEAIGFLRDGIGYVTISEGEDQPIHFFRCLPAPVATILSLETQVRIEFEGFAGQRYSLESRKDFIESAWTPTGQTRQPQSDGPQHFEVQRSTDGTFYRVIVQ